MASGTIQGGQAINIGSGINITIPSNYTFPSDGYLLAQAGYQANSYVRGRLQNQSGEDVVIVQVSQSSSGAAGAFAIPIFVRKGMKFRAQDHSNGSFTFYPLQ